MFGEHRERRERERVLELKPQCLADLPNANTAQAGLFKVLRVHGRCFESMSIGLAGGACEEDSLRGT